ncbi:MAG: ATP synthase F1 subunit epsilon [Oscillospiraceae bacterium]|jgi:F-type H+-transporting ATPase subunit epsilon
MAKLFNLKIMTPEREFFDDQVEAVTVTAPDGKMTILAGHAAIITPLCVGSVSIKVNGEWKDAFNSEGFMEVSGGGVVIFVQACEWPHEIDASRAEEAKRRADEKLRQKQSINEYKQTKMALARAMARLRISKTNTGR